MLPLARGRAGSLNVILGSRFPSIKSLVRPSPLTRDGQPTTTRFYSNGFSASPSLGLRPNELRQREIEDSLSNIPGWQRVAQTPLSRGLTLGAGASRKTLSWLARPAVNDLSPRRAVASASQEKLPKEDTAAFPSTEMSRYECIAFIEDVLEANAVVIFMKGTPAAPKCGHSKRVTDLFEKIGLRKYVAIDIMQSDTLAATLKEMTGMKTVPQVFLGGELIGGADDTFKLHEAGLLVRTMKEIGCEFND